MVLAGLVTVEMHFNISFPIHNKEEVSIFYHPFPMRNCILLPSIMHLCDIFIMLPTL